MCMAVSLPRSTCTLNTFLLRSFLTPAVFTAGCPCGVCGRSVVVESERIAATAGCIQPRYYWRVRVEGNADGANVDGDVYYGELRVSASGTAADPGKGRTHHLVFIQTTVSIACFCL